MNEQLIKTKINRFDEFWSAYPRKVGKQAARNKWDRIDPDNELVDKMLEKIEQYKKTEDWQKQNGAFIPHPTTWLNQGRWEDELLVKVDTEPTYDPYDDPKYHREKTEEEIQEAKRILHKMNYENRDKIWGIKVWEKYLEEEPNCELCKLL